MSNTLLLRKGRAINVVIIIIMLVSIGVLIGQIAWLNSIHSATPGEFLTSTGKAMWTSSMFVLLAIIAFLCYLLKNNSGKENPPDGQKDFINNLSHEFKTPLTSIQLAADVLKNPNIVSQPQRLLNYATIISIESTHLCAKVERMLQMTELEEKKVALSKTSFDWKHLLSETVDVYSTAASSKGGVINLKLPSEPLLATGDVLHVKNAIGNIIDNSLKYNAAPPAVNIAVQKIDKGIEIRIEDNGIGIEKGHQKLLFDKFYRVPTGNTHDVKGLGIGLNYVQLILKAHGGEVSCTSDLGKGSIFTLTFPYQS